jgi:regulatory protein
VATVAPEDIPDDPGQPGSVARVICLRLLTQRARTRSELAQALARRGVPADAAAQVLARLTEVGLIDDAATADSFVLHQHHERGLSRRAVAAKLRGRGVDEETVRSALGQIGAESEQAAAVHLVRRKLRSLDGLEPQVRSRRIFGLLARRGYSVEVALRALHTVTGQAVRSEHDVVDDAVRQALLDQRRSPS